MEFLSLEDLLKGDFKASDEEVIKAFEARGFETMSDEQLYQACADFHSQKVSYRDNQFTYYETDRQIAFTYTIKSGLLGVENIQCFNRTIALYEELKELGLLHKSFSELYPTGVALKSVIYNVQLADDPNRRYQAIIEDNKYVICDGPTNKIVTFTSVSKLSERLEVLKLIVHLKDHPDDQEAKQKLHMLEQNEATEQTVDSLRQEQQRLSDQMTALQEQQAAVAQEFEAIERATRAQAEADIKRIKAFLDEHPELTYDYEHARFYTSTLPNVYMTYKYPNGQLILDKAFSDIERYLQLLPILQSDEQLTGNIASQLERLNHDVTYDIRLNPDNSVTVHAQDFDTWYNHQVERDGITVSYGYPDDTEPLTILFDLEETYDNSDGFSELPQALRDMSDRIAERKKATKGTNND